MSRAKRHHQVPQFYLSYFADPKQRVRILDRTTGKLFTQLVSNVAVESNLYTIQDDTGKPSDSVEKSFAGFENVVADRLPLLLSEKLSVSSRDRWVIAQFVALQFIRTAAARELLEDTADLKHRLMIEANVGGDPPELVEKFIQKRYGNAPEEFQQQVREVAADPSRSIRISNAAWLEVSLPLVPELAKLLLARRWWLANSYKRTFLTCDNPVVLTAPAGKPQFGAGFLTAREVVFPVSPYRVLIMEGVDAGTITIIDADRKMIDQINANVANIATRQIYFHPKSDPLAGIHVPRQPQPHSVNGHSVGRGERSYDQIRQQFIPNLHRVRDEIRAASKDNSASRHSTNEDGSI